MKKILLTLIAMLMMSATSMAQSIIADGFGEDKNAAYLDAQRNAVEQVAGSFIDAETLVENSVAELSRIYSSAQGFVRNVKIISEGRASDGIYTVRASMDVDSEPNTELMSRLETIMRLNDPRITVIILKDNAAAGTHDDLAESALNDCLLNVGFSHVVDADIVANLENAVLLERIYNGEKGLVGVGSSYGADYLVLGKSHASTNQITLPDYHGGYKTLPYSNAFADLTARIVKLSTGEIIGTFTVKGAGTPGANADTVERDAIQNAAQKAAVELEKKFKKLAMTVRANRQAGR